MSHGFELAPAPCVHPPGVNSRLLARSRSVCLGTAGGDDHDDSPNPADSDRYQFRYGH
jgi:hypothetical protein